VSLKQKTVSGLTWSFIEDFSKHGIVFIVGIVLARLLTPHEFGLIGMITVFITISEGFIDSGFGQALVRKKDCSNEDFTTVFYYNFITGVIFYLVLFFTAGNIATFFNEPKLKVLVQVLGIGLIIKSVTLIHIIILMKNINFKLQTKISVIASVASGIIAIYMAYNGYGVWSLVAKTLTMNIFTSILLWFWNVWNPGLVFSKQSFKELFGFGSKLMLSGLLERIYKNIYPLVIGKYFSAADLGYFSRADQFKNLASNNILGIIQRVSFPVLASIQDDVPRMKSVYQKLIRSTMLITFFLMFAMAATAKPMILTLIGEKWLPSVTYLQLLCFVGIFFPLQAINQNMLKVLGLSNKILILEVIKKILVLPVLLLGVIYGIHVMIIAMIGHGMLSYGLDSYYSGKLIGYSVISQIRDILPSFLITLFISGIVFLSGLIINLTSLKTLLIQIFILVILSFIIFELFRVNDYLFIKKIIIEKIHSIRKNLR
jgi:O-antigen/teichoic acid export membrane protein